MLHTCQCAGFDKKVLEAQEEEERERQRKKDRKRDRQVSTLPDCWQNDSARTALSGHESGPNNVIVLPTFVSACASPQSFSHFLLGCNGPHCCCHHQCSESCTLSASVSQLYILGVQL